MSFLKIKSEKVIPRRTPSWWISSHGTSTWTVPQNTMFINLIYLNLPRGCCSFKASTGQACWPQKSCLNTLTSLQVTNSVLLLRFHLDRLKSHCVLVILLSFTQSPPPIPKIPTNKSFPAEFDCGMIGYLSYLWSQDWGATIWPQTLQTLLWI